jgi:hypothetical protein
MFFAVYCLDERYRLFIYWTKQSWRVSDTKMPSIYCTTIVAMEDYRHFETCSGSPYNTEKLEASAYIYDSFCHQGVKQLQRNKFRLQRIAAVVFGGNSSSNR